LYIQRSCAGINHAGVTLSSKVISIMTSGQHAGFQQVRWMLMHLAGFSDLEACSTHAYGICGLCLSSGLFI